MKKITLLILCAFTLFSLGQMHAQYCPPSGSAGNAAFIGEVCFPITSNPFNNCNQTNTGGNYGDYTGLGSRSTFSPTPIVPNTNQVLVRVDRSNAGDYVFSGYIDFNQDQDFNDPGENVFNGSGNIPFSSGGGASHNQTVTVPAAAINGVTRLRIIAKAGTSPVTGPCETGFNGEAEDYAITITGGGVVCPTLSFTATPSNEICPGSNNGSINITGATGGVSPYLYSINNGSTYQASSSFTGLAPNTYQVKIKDANDCESNAQSITINAGVDNTPPVANCAAPFTVQLDANGLANITLADINNGSTDNCGILSASINVTDFSCSNIGPNTVTLTITDVNGNVSTCTTTVTVEDNIAPIISCVSNATRDTDPGFCQYTVLGNEFDATFTDNCSSATITNNLNNTATLSGEVLPKGDNTIVWTVDDGNGQTATCTTIITVIDNEAPTINCVADITQDNDPGICGALVTFAEPTVTDNCSSGVLLNTMPNQTSAFTGNSRGYWFTAPEDFTITSLRVPTLASTADQSIMVMSFAAPPADYSATSSYDSLLFYTQLNPDSGFIPVNIPITAGQIIGILGVRGNVNSYTNDATININGNPLTINRLGTQNDISMGPAPQGSFWTEPTNPSKSNVDFEYILGSSVLSAIQTAGLASGSEFPVGTTTNTFEVTDAAGNTSSCSFNVTVEDNEAPVITCVADATKNTDAGVCQYTVVGTEFDATFTDNCGGSITNDLNGTATLAGEILPKGDTTIVWTVDDGNGQTATCTTVITVEDNEAPVISCVADVTKNTDAGVCQYTVVGTEFDATFTDNCGGSITNDLNGIATLAGEILPKGDTTIVWTVDDGNGQTATCTTVITVEDNEAPVISCMADATRDTDPGVCQYTVVGAELDATFNDNCADGSITNDLNGTDTLAGEILSTGDTTVVWTVDDGNGQTATCTTVITVADNEFPIIACPADIMANTDPGDCYATVTFPASIAIDNCGIDTIVQTMGDPSGSQFPVGVHTIEYTATDVNGNASTCSFTITVTDNEAPVAVCQNITIQLDADGFAGITAADVDGGSTDQCGVATTAVSRDTFDCSNVGDNDVVLTVTDVNGNVATCTATVTVEDVTAPVVACQNITVELDPVTGTVAISGTDIDNGSTDSCGIAAYGLDIDTFDCSNIGENAVVLTVTDVNGNSATCSATVTVQDNTAPVLVCQDFTLELGADGTATLDPNDVIASNDDACGILTVAVDITEYSCADIGSPVAVQIFSQDNNGNLSTCFATVTVVDTMAPVVTCPADQTVDPGAGNLFYIVPDYFATGGATAMDNCTDPVTATGQDPVAGTPLPDGVHTVTLTATDAYGNVGTCEFGLTVETVLGTDGNNPDLGNILLYPNPAKDQFTIGNPQNLGLESVEIYDLTGRMVRSFNVRGMTQTRTFDVGNLASATYMVVIRGEQDPIVKRLVKE